MLTLVLSAALSQWAPNVPPGALQYDPGAECSRTGGRCFLNRTGNRPRENYAFFEFAPSSGAGMTAPCACATITGAKGEALTLARGSDATCSKQGFATTGMADGDLVMCTGTQPRVELLGGVAGLRVEGARTNLIQRNQEFDNAYWTTATGGAPAPTAPSITANAAPGPFGGTTADRVDFASTTGTGFGILYNAAGRTSTAAQYAHSLFVRGVSGSGTVYLMSTPGGSYISTPCTFVSTSWSRCGVVGTETAVAWFTQIGFDLRDGAQSGQGAQSVYLALVQAELGSSVTSPIVTAASTATRSEEAADLLVPFSPTNGFCVAATVQYSNIAALGPGGGLTGPILTTGSSGTAISGVYAWPFAGFAGAYAAIDSAGVVSAGVASWNPGVTLPTNPSRYVYRHSGGVGAWTACTNGVCQTSGSSTFGAPAFTRIKLDRATAAVGNEPQHIITRVQVDPAPSRCN